MFATVSKETLHNVFLWFDMLRCARSLIVPFSESGGVWTLMFFRVVWMYSWIRGFHLYDYISDIKYFLLAIKSRRSTWSFRRCSLMLIYGKHRLVITTSIEIWKQAYDRGILYDCALGKVTVKADQLGWWWRRHDRSLKTYVPPYKAFHHLSRWKVLLH